MVGEEPKWAVVLRAIYENKMAGHDFLDYGFDELDRQKAIAEETGLEHKEVSNTITQMVNQGLINGIPSNDPFQGYTLTKKGFDVAHTRALRRQEQRREQNRDKRQHGVNRAIGFLTVGLLFTGFLQAWIAALVGEEARLLFINGALLLGFVIVVGIAIMLLRSGMLASWDSDREKEQ